MTSAMSSRKSVAEESAQSAAEKGAGKSPLFAKHIVLGVTGGIAAYKAIELTSRLTKAGAHVHVILTRAAQNLVTAKTFQEIAGETVFTSMWQTDQLYHVGHIALARLADVVMIAPATANCLAKLAYGLADDLLTTTVLATHTPIFLAPAMNTNMYENPVTQENLTRLRARGLRVLEPASGHLACGTEGKGRLPEPVQLFDVLEQFFAQSGDLAGRRILVTAGGTREAIDPVRFVGNRSTGRMGFAVAEAAARRGADVTLVTGPVALTTPAGVTRVDVTSALSMRAAVRERFAAADAVIMTAAVADYRPERIAAQKIKKHADSLTLTLVRNPDILRELGEEKQHQILVGFAAETEHVRENAEKKLHGKHLDLLVANDVSQKDAGFGVTTNRVIFFSPDADPEPLPLMEKRALAGVILDRVRELLKSS